MAFHDFSRFCSYRSAIDLAQFLNDTLHLDMIAKNAISSYADLLDRLSEPATCFVDPRLAELDDKVKIIPIAKDNMSHVIHTYVKIGNKPLDYNYLKRPTRVSMSIISSGTDSRQLSAVLQRMGDKVNSVQLHDIGYNELSPVTSVLDLGHKNNMRGGITYVNSALRNIEREPVLDNRFYPVDAYETFTFPAVSVQLMLETIGAKMASNIVQMPYNLRFFDIHIGKLTVNKTSINLTTCFTCDTECYLKKEEEKEKPNLRNDTTSSAEPIISIY